MADLFIFVGILLSGVLMTALGLEMSGDAKVAERKPLYRALFIALGCAFAILSIWQFIRTDAAANKAERERHEVEVRNEGNFKYQQGQLDSVNKVLSILATNSDPKHVATALSGFLPKTLPAPVQSADWILSKDREAKFLSDLRGSRGSFKILCQAGNAQSCRFARQAFALFRQSGWTSSEPDASEAMIMGSDLGGVQIRPTNPPFQEQLRRAFQGVGVDPTFSRQEGLRQDEILILVGRKPDYWRY